MFACKYVNVPCACLVSLEAKRGIQKLLELELQAMVTHYVGAMNRAQGLCRAVLSHLCSPMIQLSFSWVQI